MGFLNNVFGGKKNSSSVITDTRNKLFDIYGVSKPTDAQEMRASFYLCIAGMALFNHFAAGKVGHEELSPVIDKLVRDTAKLTSNLTMTLGELTEDEDILECFIDSVGGHITRKTTINGLAAMDMLYVNLGEVFMNDILRNTEGPLGIQGYAAVHVITGTFGRGTNTSNKILIDVTSLIRKFAKELAEATM